MARHPWLAIALAVAILAPLIVPLFSLQLGQEDIGVTPESTTERQAYDLLTRRRFYAVMVAGLALHVLRLNAELFTRTEAWLPVGRALMAPFR